MKRLSIVLFVAIFAITGIITGCRDETDPEFLLDQMHDRPWRESALKNLNEIFNQTMQENGNDLKNPKVQELVNLMVPAMIDAFHKWNRDKFNLAETQGERLSVAYFPEMRTAVMGRSGALSPLEWTAADPHQGDSPAIRLVDSNETAMVSFGPWRIEIRLEEKATLIKAPLTLDKRTGYFTMSPRKGSSSAKRNSPITKSTGSSHPLPDLAVLTARPTRRYRSPELRPLIHPWPHVGRVAWNSRSRNAPEERPARHGRSRKDCAPGHMPGPRCAA